MENPLQDFNNAEVVNQQNSQVIQFDAFGKGDDRSLIQETDGRFSVRVFYPKPVLNRGLKLDKVGAYLPLTGVTNEVQAKQVLYAFLQDKSHLNPIKVIEDLDKGLPVYADSIVSKNYRIFLQEFAIPLVPLQKGKALDFLKNIADISKMYNETVYKFQEEFRRKLTHGIYRIAGTNADTVLEQLSNPDTALFDMSLVLKQSSEFLSKYAKALNDIFFESKSTPIKKTGVDGAYCMFNDNFIFRITFATDTATGLNYVDKTVAHTNSAQLSKDSRLKRKALTNLAEETSEENTNAEAVLAVNSEE